jgi:hypothetical protein
MQLAVERQPRDDLNTCLVCTLPARRCGNASNYLPVQADSVADVPSQKLTVAVTALCNLLRGNTDSVSDLFIDQCYSAKAAIASAYFQVTLVQSVQGSDHDQSRSH